MTDKNQVLNCESRLCEQWKAKVTWGKLEQFNDGGVAWEIRHDKNDKEAKLKAKAARNAVKAIIKRGYKLPDGLEFLCTALYDVQNRAFNVKEGWEKISWVTLGIRTLKSDTASVSNMPNPGFTKADATCIHEVGHCLHAEGVGIDAFFDPDGTLKGKANHAREISNYAGANKKEFVAEVFTCIVVGRAVSHGAMVEYQSLGGPMPA